jgi:7-cyano-7-deazaguanine synthase
MNKDYVLDSLPNTKKALVILSGGMDSTIAMALCVKKYGAENVYALTFNYGQKQIFEIQKARESTQLLGVKHEILDLNVLNKISQGFSANVDVDIKMPTIQEVLGDPSPKTYVPNRNMILMSIVAGFAETQGIDTVITGLQVHDQYSYWDTTQLFVDKMNEVFSLNRKLKIKIFAPFSVLSKEEEINILKELYGNISLLRYTLTCYNPNYIGESCGECPSCSERIANFVKTGNKDLISYSKVIPWEKLLCVQ